MVAGPLLQVSLQALELRLRIARRIHLRVRLGHLPLFVDHVRDAAGVLVFRGLGGAVREADLALRVAEQREGEVVLLREAGVGFLVVEADAEDSGVLGFVLFDEVPEPGPFPRSTGCVGLRIEPEHDFLAAQVGKAHAIALVIVDVEVGSLLAGLDHGRSSSGHHLDDSAQRHARIVGP